MNEDILVPFFGLAAISFISWIVIASIRRFLIARLQASVQARLLDKLPSAETLIAYTQTAAGRDFISSILEERAARTSPYKSILHGVQAAILLSVFGVTLLLLHRNLAFSGDGELFFGSVSLALGIGFALAAGATWLLSSRFGLFDPHLDPHLDPRKLA